MDLFSVLATLITLALGVAVVWTRVEKIIAAIREIIETLTAIANAFEDGKLTAEELVNIKREVLEDIEKIKAIFK
jgi:hypothetical protein